MLLRGALACLDAACGLTLACEKTSLADGDVADIGIRAGTLHPCPSALGPSESFRKNKRKKGLHRECRFPEISRKKQGKKVMGKVIFRVKETKRVDLHIHTTIYS